jgi:hypothetical protein
LTPFKHINAALNAGGSRGSNHSVNMMIDVTGARGNTEIHEMIAIGVQTGMDAVHSNIARDIEPMTARCNRRYG